MSVIRAVVALLFALLLGGGAVLAQDASPSPGGAAEGASSPAPAVASPATASPATGTDGQGQEVEVSGVEYAFVGVPANVAVGTSFRLRNDGAEVHEFALARRNDGTDQTVEELLAMEEDEALTLITLVGTIWAEPGQTSQDTLTMSEPGRYIAVCFIPQGTTELPEGFELGPEAGASPGTGVDASPGTDAGTGVDASPGTEAGTSVDASPATAADASPATGADASPGTGVDASPATGLGDGPPHVALGMFVEFTVGDDAGMDAGASPAIDASPGADPSPGAGMDAGTDASPEPSPAG